MQVVTVENDYGIFLNTTIFKENMLLQALVFYLLITIPLQLHNLHNVGLNLKTSIFILFLMIVLIIV